MLTKQDVIASMRMRLRLLERSLLRPQPKTRRVHTLAKISAISSQLRQAEILAAVER